MYRKKLLFVTTWEDLASNKGAELLRQVRQLQEYPIILAKRIGTTKYQGGKFMQLLFLHMDYCFALVINKIFMHSYRFATRYNSTILINPLYVQATELRNWINESKQMLIEYTMKSSAESASPLNLVAVDDEILSVSAITTQSSTNPASDSTEVSACYQFNRELARQRAALTGASSSTLRTVNDSTVSDNGKDLHDRSSIFEVGSTSGTCSEQYNITMHNATSKENMCSIDMLLDMEAELLEKKKQKRNTVSCREYYCYKLQMRDDEENGVLHAGRVFQQYSVDEFIKLETQRLDFYSFNQDLFRIDALAGILDVLRHGEREPCNIGRQSFLPTSFIGGPRDMRRRYMDAIALVQNFGKPDIFLTMTCNPSWPEIEEHLLVTDEVQNRPDLVSRVFRAKVDEMKTDILKRNIFGKVAASMYTIEFQKRGLPHAHFLIILKDEYKLLTPESYDRVVCAEIPDSDKNDYLYSVVTKHMMHEPCGSLNPKCPCMKN
uniref:Uncharacterized protein LOC104229090 n=1 Tax=Nicotiana sylvestris TaxID=4096 RepID=A0A1U7WN14_NICSY|nr:PREDICTED: uncharacterized protein LOC104229090 [Nicotiana sylvestris]